MVNIPEIKLLPHPETGELVPEVWVPVIGYEHLYKISNYSRLLSIRKEPYKLLVASPAGGGYLSHNLCNDGKIKSIRLHKLTYNSFYGPSDDKSLVIDHKDNNKYNNFLHNLQRISVRRNSCKDRKRKYGQPLGVYKSKKGWNCSVFVNGKKVYLGYASTKEAAHQKYIEGVKRLGLKIDV